MEKRASKSSQDLTRAGSRRSRATRPSPSDPTTAKTRRPAATERPSSITIVAFSDCRSQPVELMIDWLRRQPTKPDLIVYAGDDCERFRPDPKTNYFELMARQSRFGLAAVIGNDDTPSSRSLVAGEKVREVHSDPLDMGDVIVVGSDGAPDRPGVLPFGPNCRTENDIARHLRTRLRGATDRKVLVVSHAPPEGVLDLSRRFQTAHIGSSALRAQVEKTGAIRLVICGHVHSQGGRSGKLGNACVVNVASHDDYTEPLRVAEINWSGLSTADECGISVKWHLLRAVGSVPGVGLETRKKLQAAGIISVEALAHTQPAVLARVLGKQPKTAARLIALAEAQTAQTPRPLKPFVPPRGPRIYFDIETDTQFGSRYVWLIGCLDESNGEFRQFLAQTPARMPAMLRRFAKYCENHEKSTMLSYSGSNFDRNKTMAHMEAHGIPVPPVLAACEDVLPQIRFSVAMPSSSYGLKEVAPVLGFSFRHNDLSGFAVAAAYEDACQKKKPIPRKLLEYNEDDVRALAHVVGKVEALTADNQTKRMKSR